MEIAQYTDNRSVLRIHRELAFIKNSKEIAEWGISVEVANDNLALLRAQISGPSDTPYEGGNFILEIKIPESYPFKAPKCTFSTKIWHPNICSATGKICLFYWIPSMRVIDILFSVQAFLSTAQPDDNIDPAVAKQYRENPEQFRFKARHWTQTYALAARTPNQPDAEQTAVVVPKQNEENIEISKSAFQLNDGKTDIVYKQFQGNSELSKSLIQPGNGQASIVSKKYNENSEIPKSYQDNTDFGEMVATFMSLTVEENKTDASSSWNLEKARAMLANLHF